MPTIIASNCWTATLDALHTRIAPRARVPRRARGFAATSTACLPP